MITVDNVLHLGSVVEHANVGQSFYLEFDYGIRLNMEKEKHTFKISLTMHGRPFFTKTDYFIEPNLATELNREVRAFLCYIH